MFMKSRPSEFNSAMLAAHTPDAVPNHPGSADVQRTNVLLLPQCSPCTLPPRHVYPSSPLPTTLPRPSVTSIPHTHLPTRFVTPHVYSPGTEDSPSPPPPPVLLDAFNLLHTTPPLPHTTFPLSPTHSRFASPNPFVFVALESPYDSDDEDPSPPALLCPITPSSIVADSGATHVLLNESILPSLAHLMHPRYSSTHALHPTQWVPPNR
jgi:hypothetical protein